MKRSPVRRQPALVAIAVVTVLALSGARAKAAAPGPNLPAVMTPQTQGAIDKGLAYLAKTQQPDGSFPASWNASSYPATMTALAGLTFMAGGSTPEDGPYADQVKKAMVYLLELAESRQDGLIAGKDEKRSTYGHGYSMLFLAQCYGMEQSTEYEGRIRRALEKAIDLVARGQSKNGGWLYSPAGGGDEGSTTGIVIQGLRACRNAGIKVPKETIDRAIGYLRQVQNPDGGIAYSLAFRGASRPALAAQALACFYAAGVYDRQAGGDTPEAVMVEKLWRYLKALGDDESGIAGFFFYHHFYLAQAMYVRGGPEWDAHYKKVSKALLERQAANGSWAGDDVGPTYGTALACMILQMPYGYLPICEK